MEKRSKLLIATSYSKKTKKKLPNERLLLFVLEWRNTKFLKKKSFLTNTLPTSLSLSFICFYNTNHIYRSELNSLNTGKKQLATSKLLTCIKT